MSSNLDLDLDFLEYTPTSDQDAATSSSHLASSQDQPGVQIKIPESIPQQSAGQRRVPPSSSPSNLFQNLMSNAANLGSQSGMSEEALRQLMWAANRQRQGQQNTVNKSAGNFGWGLNHLSQYFDVTTTDVVERIVWSAVPIRKTGIDIDKLDDADELTAPLASGSSFQQESDKANLYGPSSSNQRPYSYIERFIQSRPDFYGPFWVSATLVFAIGLLSNIVSFAKYHYKLMRPTPSDSLMNGNIGLNKSAEVFSDQIRAELDSWHYSMDELNMSSNLVMIYVTVLPTLLWFVFWFRGCTRFYTLTETVCAYGYSLSVFVPLALMLTIQNVLFRYFTIAIASTLSGLVLMQSFLPVAKSDPNPATSHIILAIVPLCQFGLGYFIHRIMLQ